jgi:dipeptidyl aminopeptidase/acylaminoacyl peptidase
MTDHTPMDGFETRLTALVRSYTEPAATPSDPVLTARTAMASTTRGGVLGRLWPVGLDRRVAWLLLLAALVMTLAALAVAVGSRQSLVVQVPDGPGRIVFVRDGDLFVAETDGSGQSLIASGDAGDAKFGYLTAAWSPDMRHIAAVRDVGGAFLTPGVDLMTADGALVRTVALDTGCGPSLSWSPDSSEVAIATCPADVPRDASEPVESGIGLLLAGLDASAEREISLPPEWQSVASANPEVWIRPDLWARWSPDGRWIALWAIVAGQQERYLVAADGSGTRRIEELTDTLSRVQSFDWSPDGRKLAISGEFDRYVDDLARLQAGCVDEVCLGIVDSEGGPVTSPVEHPSARDPNMHGKVFWPEFSPDGDRVAVLGLLIDFTSEPEAPETYTLYDYDLATGRFTELTSGIRSMILDATGAAHPTGTVTGELVVGGTVAWTRDGRRLLYLVREAGDSAASWTIRSIDAAGGSQSSVLVRGVQSFDIGWPKP